MEDKYNIITAISASTLAKNVRDFAKMGWKPVGSHQVITTHMSVERAGTQHRYQTEYSQTLIRE